MISDHDAGYDERRNMAHAQFIAWFRKTYRPKDEHEAWEFEQNFERLVMEITTRVYREAQAPFVAEFRAMRAMTLREGMLRTAPREQAR